MDCTDPIRKMPHRPYHEDDVVFLIIMSLATRCPTILVRPAVKTYVYLYFDRARNPEHSAV